MSLQQKKWCFVLSLIHISFNWSPMKIDHLIDNYTGIIGKLNRSVTADGFSPSNLYGTSFSADSVYSVSYTHLIKAVQTYVIQTKLIALTVGHLM